MILKRVRVARLFQRPCDRTNFSSDVTAPVTRIAEDLGLIGMREAARQARRSPAAAQAYAAAHAAEWHRCAYW